MCITAKMSNNLLTAIAAVWLSVLPAIGADYYAAGEACLKAGNIRQAVAYFKSEIAYRNHHAAAHFGLAKAYFLLGQKDDAARELQTTVALDPTGAFGEKARDALAKRDSVLARRAGLNRFAGTAGLTAMRMPSALNVSPASGTAHASSGSTLSPFGKSKPTLSEHCTREHFSYSNEIDAAYREKLSQCKSEWDKGIKNVVAVRDQLAEGTAEREAQEKRLADCISASKIDVSELEERYLQEYRKINADAESKYAERMQVVRSKSAASVSSVPNQDRTREGSKQGQKNSLSIECANRLAQLESEANRKVDELSHEWEAKVAWMRKERSAQQLAAPKSEYDRVTAEWDVRIDDTQNQFKLRMYALKQDYAKRFAQLGLSTDSLQTTNNRSRDDDAKLIPVGKTNLYSRSYETFGTPEGSGVPLIAEPLSLSGAAKSAAPGRNK